MCNFMRSLFLKFFSGGLEGGSQIIFHQRPPKKTENANFLNIHLIKNENINPYAKMSDYRDDEKIFEFRPILPLF